jgi:hypothetical protein
MRPLSASTVIEVWERGSGRPPVERALVMLSACTDEPAGSLPALTVGQRDVRLMAMYRRLFGETLSAFAECPQCSERLEYSMSTRDLNITREIPADGENLTLVCGDCSLRLRLPNSLDLRVASQCRTVAEARTLLAQRCIVTASVDVEELPDSIVEKIAARLAEADPLAEMLIHLTCTACRHQWQTVLDIEQFLWIKVASLAKRLLREVHVLARAYGWPEAEILAMTATRRQFYLEMTAA